MKDAYRRMLVNGNVLLDKIVVVDYADVLCFGGTSVPACVPSGLNPDTHSIALAGVSATGTVNTHAPVMSAVNLTNEVTLMPDVAREQVCPSRQQPSRPSRP